MPKKFFHTAGNFREHEEESKQVDWDHEIAPWIVFFQNVDALIGQDDPVIYPEHMTEELDYELELAVILKKPGKWFSPEEAADYIGGYVIFNDITARDIQRREMRSGVFSFCKAIDTFCPLGPWIVTPDEIADPHNLKMELRVNGDAAAGVALLAHVGHDPRDPQPLLGARLLGRRRALDRHRRRRRRLLARRRLALPQARRRHGVRDRGHRRAAQPGDLVAGGPRRARAAAGALVTWPRDEAKLERVRALMAERELDALVVRAPDAILYLTNFWGMKGYDACVFPREGEPVLICLEASAADAARTAWTSDVRLFPGYERDAIRARRACGRSSSPRGSPRDYGRVAIELSGGTQASDRMVGEPTTFGRAWFDAFPDAADATPLLVAARSLKTPQEVERMRLANEIAAAAMEHMRGVLRPGMTCAQAAAAWQGFVHGEGTGWKGKVDLALPFSLIWSGPSIRTFTATSAAPVQEGEPTLFEIWVCADGYWADHTKNLVCGELKPRYRELEQGLLAVYDEAVDSRAARRQLRRRSTAACARASTPSASRASPRTRSCTASARVRTSRPTRTRPSRPRSSRAWCWRSSPAATGPRAAACASRTTSSSPRPGRRSSAPSRMGS